VAKDVSVLYFISSALLMKSLLLLSQSEKNIRSSYSRDALAEAEKTRSQYVRNISRAHRRRYRMPSNENTKSGEISQIEPPLLLADKVDIEADIDLMTISREDGKPIRLRTAQQIRKDIARSIHEGGPLPDYERSWLFRSDGKRKNEVEIKGDRMTSSKDGEYVLRYFGAKEGKSNR